MILTGTNYNIRPIGLEHERLHGSGLYNESRAEHFRNLQNYRPVVGSIQKVKQTSNSAEMLNKAVKKKDDISPDQLSEVILRVSANKPRRVIKNKTPENTKTAQSGRSTAGINRTRRIDKKQSGAIMVANTIRQTQDTQQPI